MIENTDESPNSCKYCGYKFQPNVIEKILENNETVICEFCGIEINVNRIDTQEGFGNDLNEKTSNLKNNIKIKKKFIVKKFGKFARAKRYSVHMIKEDKDFPKIFKENLIIVTSRLTYYFLREWEQENNANIHHARLNQAMLKYLAGKLKPIFAKRIGRSFLDNLHNISINEFNDSLKLLQEKMESNQDYRTHFLTFLMWVQGIVFKLVSEMWEMTNLPKLHATILKDLKSYSFYSPKLEEIVKRDTSRKDSGAKEIEKNRKMKECGRCHEFKPYDNFEFRRDSRREKGYYRSICKECRLENKQIYALKNKYKIVQNIYKGKLKGKCQKCNTNIEKLPSLDFHHSIPELKSQRIRFGHINWEKAMKKLENERVNLQCKNCHSQEQAKVYYKYERFIQGFEKKFLKKNPNPAQIEKLVGKLIKQHSEEIHRRDRPQFKRWLRKYIVIGKLYDGKCIACEEITIKNNLPGLQFHHRDLKNPNRKEWKKILTRPIPEIVKTLKSENCVSICANCQMMIHAHQFKNNHENIVGIEYWNQIKQYYKIAEKNIISFKFN